MEKINQEYNSLDLVKLEDKKTGAINYGMLYIFSNSGKMCDYKCYLIDEDAYNDKSCIKYFYLYLPFYEDSEKVISKASVDELSHKQKEIFNKLKED